MTDATEDTFVLREFRLATADADGAVARIVAATPGGCEPAVPLLTSIDDHRDVATIERTHDGGTGCADEIRHALLDPFVVSWGAAKQYVPRIAERSKESATHYRLAVTESGINDEMREASQAAANGARRESPASLDLLWIGQPRASYAGLLILLGDRADPRAAPSATRDWPLLMSRGLGVRIYDSAA